MNPFFRVVSDSTALVLYSVITGFQPLYWFLLIWCAWTVSF